MSERVFVGRARELEQACALVDGVAAGRGALACFSGEAGIGKTRLATQVADLASERGFRVAWGRCWETGGAPAYWPWTQVFEQLAIPDPFAAGAAATTDARELRFKTFDAAVRALAAAATETPLVLVLDDLHAADVPSLELLRVLARGLARTRLLVLATYREVEARLAGEVGTLLAKIGREGDVLPLPRLSRQDVIAWVRRVAPATSADDAARVCDTTEGNPLFVHELLRARTRIDVRRLPDGLHAILEEHVARVDDDLRDLLASASVLGREIDAADVAALVGDEPDRIEAQLLVACDSGLLEPIADRGRGFAFSHALVRDRMYARLPVSRRAALHARAGDRLAATDAARATFHLVEGRSAVADLARIGEVACIAARAALSRYAFEDALRLVALARPVVTGLPALACELDVLDAEALIRSGDPERGKALCVDVVARAQALGRADLAAHAALVYGLELASGQIDPTMIRLLREAHGALADGDPQLRARVAIRLATAMTPPVPENYAEIRTLTRDALALARTTCDPATRLYVEYYALASHYYHLDRSERRELCDDVLVQLDISGDPIACIEVLPRVYQHLRERGLIDRANAVFDRFAASARELGRPRYLWRVPLLDATRAILDGRLDDADAAGREALALAEQHQVFSGVMAWSLHRIALAMAHDDPARIAPDAPKLLQAFGRSKTLASFAAWVHAAVGDRVQAHALLGENVAHRATLPPTIFAGAIACLLGDRELAANVFEVVEENSHEHEVFWGAPAFGTVIGPTARIAADLAALLGRTADAARLYDEAIAIGERMAAPVLTTLARKRRDQLGNATAPARAPGAPTLASLAHSGEAWSLAFEGRTHVLKPRRGLDHLARLLSEPGQETHVLELAGSEVASERGEVVLDAKAKAAYRARIEQLRDKAEDAEARGDSRAAERARAEIEAIADELARALGIGGRDRTTASAADRARAAVTMALRRAIEAISELEPTLGAHLAAAVKTGTFCAYRPDPSARVTWQIAQ